MQEPQFSHISTSDEQQIDSNSNFHHHYDSFSSSSSFRTQSVSSTASHGSSAANDQLRIGQVRCLQIFLYHSSQLLLNKSNYVAREKCRNVCCYLLDIYKTIVKKLKMDSYTWTMIVTILLRVAEFVFKSEQLMPHTPLPPSSISVLSKVNNGLASDPVTIQFVKLLTEVRILT
jgi:hypothetical protein